MAKRRKRRTYNKSLQNAKGTKALGKLNIKRSHLPIILTVAAAVLLIAIAITVTLILLNRHKENSEGWQQIELDDLSSSVKESFILNYYIDDNVDLNMLKEVYKNALLDGFAAFDCESSAITNGIYALNQNPNTEISVPDELYRALMLLTENSSRMHCLGPIYELYAKLFTEISANAAPSLDPTKNSHLTELCASLAGFANDSSAVSIEFVGDEFVRLNVSDEYAEFLNTSGLTQIIGFGWQRDAFIVDLIASELELNGFTKGTISSYSGFTRNLDNSEDQDYTFGLYDKYRENIYLASSVSYKGKLTTVTYKTFSMNRIDKEYLYEYKNGDVTHGYIDTHSGMPLAANDLMLFHSKDMSCAELALKTAPSFMKDAEDGIMLDNLLKLGIGTVYCDGTTIVSNSDVVTIFDLFTSDTVKYSVLK